MMTRTLQFSRLAHPLHYLLENVLARDLFPPADFWSNLPSRPRRTIQTSQSRTVEYGPSVRARWTVSRYLPCTCSRQPRCPWPCLGRIIPSRGKYSPCLRQGEICLLLESLFHCEQVYEKIPFGCGDCARIKIFRFDTNVQKIQITSDWIFLAVTMHQISAIYTYHMYLDHCILFLVCMFFLPSCLLFQLCT